MKFYCVDSYLAIDLSILQIEINILFKMYNHIWISICKTFFFNPDLAEPEFKGPFLNIPYGLNTSSFTNGGSKDQMFLKILLVCFETFSICYISSPKYF